MRPIGVTNAPPPVNRRADFFHPRIWRAIRPGPALALGPMYQSYYGLTELPVHITPDPKLLNLSREEGFHRAYR